MMTRDEPQNCPNNPPWGSIDSSLLKTKRNQRQANQCYLQWLNNQYSKPLEWKYMDKDKQKEMSEIQHVISGKENVTDKAESRSELESGNKRLSPNQ